jgi:NADH-quinone oxidoreductase subunit H
VIDLGISAADLVGVVVRAAFVIAAFLVLPLVVGQTEHKVMAHMQSRLGPMYAGGFHGWAQLVADGVKFAQKEEIVPAAADRVIFRIAPAVALVPYLVAMAAVPLSPTVVAANVDGGLLFVLAASAVGVLGTLMAGWSSANKYALLGAMRSAAQLLSYELPLVLAGASVAMAAGSLNLVVIAEAWRPWWLLWQAPAAFVFLAAGLAELQRPPFDMPVADSELVVGPYTEYSGLRFALFLLAEYAGIVLLSALCAVLFLGGWRGPLDGVVGGVVGGVLAPVWMLLKTGLVAFVVIWLRVSWPRLREDQLQRFAWGLLVPMALAQLALTAVVVVTR